MLVGHAVNGKSMTWITRVDTKNFNSFTTIRAAAFDLTEHSFNFIWDVIVDAIFVQIWMSAHQHLAKTEERASMRWPATTAHA